MRRPTPLLAACAAILAASLFFQSPAGVLPASAAPPGSRPQPAIRAASVKPVRLTGGYPGLAFQASFTNTTAHDISIETGCGTSGVLLLQSPASGAAYRARPDDGAIGNTCVTRPLVIHPGGTVPLAGRYQLVGVADGSSTPTAIPADTYDASLQISYTEITGDPAHRYRRQSDGSIIDTFPTSWTTSPLIGVQVGNVSVSPPIRSISPKRALTGPARPFQPRVLVIDYNTSGTSNDGSAALTSQLTNAFDTASRYHGAGTSSAQFQVYQRDEEDNAPPILPGAQHGTVQGDYQAIFQKYDICHLAATKGIQFVWIWAAGTEAGGPFYAGDFYEWVTTGPAFSQTYGASVPTCGDTVVTMGLNYSRTVAEALHSHGHYVENVLQWAFGPGDYNGPGGTDMYDLFDGQLSRYAGYTGSLDTTGASCGDVHFPPNTTQGYDYSNTTVVESDCASFDPGIPGEEQYTPVSAATWRALPCDASIQNNPGDCDQQSYLTWWMQNMPGPGNTVYDCGGNPMPNWWQYIVALDTVTTTTSNDCSHVATLAAGPGAGPRGSVVTITGSGFGANETVRVRWDSSTALSVSPATVTTDGSGSFNASVVIPKTSVGTHLLTAVGMTSGEIGRARFSVTR